MATIKTKESRKSDFRGATAFVSPYPRMKAIPMATPTIDAMCLARFNT